MDEDSEIVAQSHEARYQRLLSFVQADMVEG
jgi:hypothetical protein